MPLRTYVCPRGHETELIESMDGPRLEECPETYPDGGECGEPVESHLQRTTAIVKGGTRTFHPHYGK